jgi:hypothetical protein
MAAATATRGTTIAFDSAVVEDVLVVVVVRDMEVAEVVVRDVEVVVRDVEVAEVPTEIGVTEVSTCSPRTWFKKMS